MRSLANTIVPVLTISILAGCTAVIDQRSFFPQVAKRQSTGELQAPSGYIAQDIIFELPDLGKLHAVRLDNPATTDVIIYSGGNGNFVADQTERASALADTTGMDIILYDYPGRGGTDIPSTIEASLATGPAFLKSMRDAGWIGNGRLYAYGLSFGGSQAAAMVRGGDFTGLIIEGSASDIAAIGKNFVPGLAKPFVKLKIDPGLAKFEYYNYAVASKAPILLLSSVKDSVVKPKNMAAFADKLRSDGIKVEFVSVPGSHGTALLEEKAKASIKAFVTRH